MTLPASVYPTLVIKPFYSKLLFIHNKQASDCRAHVIHTSLSHFRKRKGVCVRDHMKDDIRAFMYGG